VVDVQSKSVKCVWAGCRGSWVDSVGRHRHWRRVLIWSHVWKN